MVNKYEEIITVGVGSVQCCWESRGVVGIRKIENCKQRIYYRAEHIQ